MVGWWDSEGGIGGLVRFRVLMSQPIGGSTKGAIRRANGAG